MACGWHANASTCCALRLAALRRYGISIASQKKAVYERVAAIRDRIKELGLMPFVESNGEGLEDTSGEAGAAFSIDDDDAGGPGGGGGGGKIKLPLPLDDQAWLGRLQERVGPLVSRINGQRKEPPTLPCIAAAVEMCQISQLNLVNLCVKHSIPVEQERSNLALFGHLRELRDRIKTLGARAAAAGLFSIPRRRCLHAVLPCRARRALASLRSPDPDACTPCSHPPRRWLTHRSCTDRHSRPLRPQRCSRCRPRRSPSRCRGTRPRCSSRCSCACR